MYRRDAAGIATGELVPPSPGPWDDCFTDLRRPPVLRWPGFLELTDRIRLPVLGHLHVPIRCAVRRAADGATRCAQRRPDDRRTRSPADRRDDLALAVARALAISRRRASDGRGDIGDEGQGASQLRVLDRVDLGRGQLADGRRGRAARRRWPARRRHRGRSPRARSGGHRGSATRRSRREGPTRP